MFRQHTYKWSKPFMSVRHEWSLIGPRGGIHFHASQRPEYDAADAICGLEFHRYERQGDNAPSHTPCWLLGAPCWHDGTSLYAGETLWPRIEPLLRAGNHDAVFRILEREYHEHHAFKCIDAEAA